VNILAINVGSTSTRLALFEDLDCVFEENIPYQGSEPLVQQLQNRKESISEVLNRWNVNIVELDIIVSRGGIMKPLPAGVYEINEEMCQDVLSGRYGVHPSALGPPIALEFAKMLGIKAVTVDPPSSDEFHGLAKISGIPEIERRGALHMLSQKAAARLVAEGLGIRYENGNFIIAHLGGGISIGAHLKGEVVDCANALSEGALTPERAGALPSLDLIDLCHKMDVEKLRKRLVGEGGLYAYLGTKDARAIETKIINGDKKAELVYEAMAYQISKEIGSMATVLRGEVNAIVLTGALSNSEMLVKWIKERVKFIAPILIVAENEMLALAQGALRVLKGEVEPQKYGHVIASAAKQSPLR
jgi:butyrate kinase